MTIKNSNEVPKIEALESLGENEIISFENGIQNCNNEAINILNEDEISNLETAYKTMMVNEIERRCDNMERFDRIDFADDGVWSKEWSSEDAINFASQFINYADDSGIDFEKYDFNEFNEEYFRQKFPKFDDIVYEKLAEYSQKKMEDHRQKPLSIQYGSFNPFEEHHKSKEKDD